MLQVNKDSSVFDIVPDEIMELIFSNLNITNLSVLSLVNKKWHEIVVLRGLWRTQIYKELSFGNRQWVHHLGEGVIREESNEDFASLPLNIVEEYRQYKRAFPELDTKNNLMLVRVPKTFNEATTLVSVGNILKRSFDSKNGYRTGFPIIGDEIKYKPIRQSHWVLMGKNWIRKIESIDFLKDEFKGYHIPKVLDATLCLFADFLKHKTNVLSDNPRKRFMTCQEQYGTTPVILGAFNPEGLYLNINRYHLDNVGFILSKSLPETEEEDEMTRLLGSVRRFNNGVFL